MTYEYPHWSEDRYWTEALDKFGDLRKNGTDVITLDLNAIAAVIYDGNGPAYKLMEAMCSVNEHEGYEGCRGAPRLTLALLSILKDISENRID